MTIRKRSIIIYSIILALIVLAISSRIAARVLHMQYTPLYYLSHIIYPVIIAYWGFWIWRRIIEKRLQMLLLSLDLMIIFWLISRSIKYVIDFPEFWSRIIWYLYYLPLLFLPIILLHIAMVIGKPEHYRLPVMVHWLGVVGTVLFLLVLTNDFHQLVFRFDTIPIQNNLYHYGPISILITVWELTLYVAVFYIMQKKCRRNLSYWKVFVIMLPLITLLFYHISYVVNFRPILSVFWDLTNVLCVCLVVYLELCIIYGVIPSNRFYLELTDASSVKIQLLDKACRPLLNTVFDIPETERLSVIEEQPLLHPDGTRTNVHAIKNGWVLWQDNISDLLSIQTELQEIQDFLKDQQQVFQKEIDTKKKITYTAEKNRLYDLMLAELDPELQAYHNLATTDVSQMTDTERTLLLGKLSLICSYIKRLCNLIIINQMDGYVKSRELSYCFRETMENLKFMGISGQYHFNLTEAITYEQFKEAYSVFYHLLLANLKGLSAVFASLYQANARTVLVLRLSCDTPIDICQLKGLLVETDEEDMLLTYPLKEVPR